MIASLVDLPPFGRDGSLQVVVEAPKGSTVKLAYDAELGIFGVSRGLPMGIGYPYDWGFIPGTLASDGDPVDAIVLHATATYPGVVLPCTALGMVRVLEDTKKGRRRTNNRIVAMPTWNDRLGDLERTRDLPLRIRQELEEFFVSTTFFTAKRIEIVGWEGKRRTAAFIRKHIRKVLTTSH